MSTTNDAQTSTPSTSALQALVEDGQAQGFNQGARHGAQLGLNATLHALDVHELHEVIVHAVFERTYPDKSWDDLPTDAQESWMNTGKVWISTVQHTLRRHSAVVIGAVTDTLKDEENEEDND